MHATQFIRRGVLFLLGYVLVGLHTLRAQQTTGQILPVKFGKITPDQFTVPTLDSTADAIVLHQSADVVFDISTNGITNLWFNTIYHYRILIRKKSAYDRATVSILTQRGSSGQHELVTGFEGLTHNLVNGAVTTEKLTKAGHFTEKVSDQIWNEKYTLPNVREGAIIEYQYTLRTPFNIRQNPPTWYFQQDIPVKWSEYKLVIPNALHYKVHQSGYLPIAGISNAVGDEMRYRFVVQNAPAFRDEPYITTVDDYLSKVEFEISSILIPGTMTQHFSTDWETIDRGLLEDEDVGGQLKRAGFLRETAKTLLSAKPDTLGRIMAAYDFIRSTVKWNEVEAYWTKNTRKAFDDKKGDAADINLMLIALLRDMNIDANPVVLSTRSHGRIDMSYPLRKKYNYVIAQVSVKGKDMLLDATDPYLLPGMLPFRCLNGIGRLVHPTAARFISLIPADRSIQAKTGTFTLNSDGEISGTVQDSYSGYGAYQQRELFAQEGKAKYLESMQRKKTSWKIDKSEVAEDAAKLGTFKVTYTFTIPEACMKTPDRLYLRPMLTEAYTTNLFKEQARLFPVDFGVATEETYVATYTLPEGYQVEELPKPTAISLPQDGGRFQYQVATTPTGQLQVISRVQLRKPIYTAEEYQGLREFFSRIVDKHAEQIVLKQGTVAEKK